MPLRVLYLYSHNAGSRAARELARHLLVRRIRHTDSKFRGKAHYTLINWGASELPYQARFCRVLNPPEAVVEVSNKLTFFQHLRGLDLTPNFSTSVGEADDWIQRNYKIVCRTLLRASGGDGIVIARTREELVPAPLYVRYVPKMEEYRVHVFDGRIIDIQKKMKKKDVDNPDWTVRNLAGGFIYGREDIRVPTCVPTIALSTFAQFRLDFGAVDVIYNQKKDRAYALEINTAPGLEGQTVVSYAAALKELLT